MSVAAKAAHLWVAQQLVFAPARDSSPAHLPAATRESGSRGRDLHSAPAKGADGDECAVGRCAQRSEWSDGDGDPAGHREGRTGPATTGDAEERAGEGQPGRDRPQPRGNGREELRFVLTQTLDLYD